MMTQLRALALKLAAVLSLIDRQLVRSHNAFTKLDRDGDGYGHEALISKPLYRLNIPTLPPNSCVCSHNAFTKLDRETLTILWQSHNVHRCLVRDLDKSKQSVRCTRSLLLGILDVHNVGN
eukprot:4715603-Pyramimonas_sp.AAC.1